MENKVKKWLGGRGYSIDEVPKILEEFGVYIEKELIYKQSKVKNIGIDIINKYGRHQHYLGSEQKPLVEFDEWKDS